MIKNKQDRWFLLIIGICILLALLIVAILFIRWRNRTTDNQTELELATIPITSPTPTTNTNLITTLPTPNPTTPPAAVAEAITPDTVRCKVKDKGDNQKGIWILTQGQGCPTRRYFCADDYLAVPNIGDWYTLEGRVLDPDNNLLQSFVPLEDLQ